MTKGGPSLRDSAGAQLWGVAKTMFWLGPGGRQRHVGRAVAAHYHRQLDLRRSCRMQEHGRISREPKNAIREAAQNVRSYLDVAGTFDGREMIVEL